MPIVNVLHPITKNGKAFFLAYDQGLEHGPTDFNLDNADPNFILNLAVKGKFTAVITHRGIAEKYYKAFAHKVPLILKLNGKTALMQGVPFSPLLCTVHEAKALGAVAVGYTVYIGSDREGEMLATLAAIVEEAHKLHMPVIAWMYPRGPHIASDTEPHIVAYAARVGMEIGVDMVKIKAPDNIDALRWVIHCAGKTQVVLAGGSKAEENVLLEEAKQYMAAGAAGLAIGRNVWQQEKPLAIADKLRPIVLT